MRQSYVAVTLIVFLFAGAAPAVAQEALAPARPFARPWFTLIYRQVDFQYNDDLNPTVRLDFNSLMYGARLSILEWRGGMDLNVMYGQQSGNAGAPESPDLSILELEIQTWSGRRLTGRGTQLSLVGLAFIGRRDFDLGPNAAGAEGYTSWHGGVGGGLMLRSLVATASTLELRLTPAIGFPFHYSDDRWVPPNIWVDSHLMLWVPRLFGGTGLALGAGLRASPRWQMRPREIFPGQTIDLVNFRTREPELRVGITW